MGLLSRTMLLMGLMILAVSFAFGLREALNSTPNDIDRLVAARNFRRAVAYRAVDYQGGRVARSDAGKNFRMTDPAQGEVNGPSSTRPGAEIPHTRSLAAREANEANETEKALNKEIERLRDGWKTEAGVDEPGVATLKNSIAEKNLKRRQITAGLAEVEDLIRVFAFELDSYSALIKNFQQRIFNLDYEVQLAIVERDALNVEKLQVEAEGGRLARDLKMLEEENYRLSKTYARTAKIIAMYESYEPSIRAWSARVGNPWLRGVVTRAHEDSRVGTVWISIGSQDGVIPNQIFSIDRGGQFIAHFRVENVERNSASGRLLKPFLGIAHVKKGDRVRGAANFGQALKATD